MRQRGIGFEGMKKKGIFLQNAKKQSFDQPVVSTLLLLWDFITHLLFCQSAEDLIKINSSSLLFVFANKRALYCDHMADCTISL